MTHILKHAEGGVLTLTFNRVERKNAMTPQMYDDLAQALHTAQGAADVRVVVIQAQPEIFCAGNDMEDFVRRSEEIADDAPQERSPSPAFDFLHSIASFPKPLIASVCGPAVGIGATLTLHCDLVFAGDNVALVFPFVNLGIVAEAGSTLLVPQLIGYHRAAEALLLGEPIYAEAALEVGLVNKVLPPTQVNAYTQGVAQKLAAKPINSLVQTKRLMKMHSVEAVHARIDEEGQVFLRMLRQPAAREAFAAFMQKRKPDFSGL